MESKGEDDSIKVGNFENGARAKRVRMRYEDASHRFGVSETSQSTRWEEESQCSLFGKRESEGEQREKKK